MTLDAMDGMTVSRAIGRQTRPARQASAQIRGAPGRPPLVRSAPAATPMKPTLTRTDVFEVLRRHRAELERFGVKTIGLFGSYARDAQTEASDVDFVVEFRVPTYDNFAGLERFLERLFNRRVDILTPAGVDSIRVPHIVEDIKRTLVHV